MTGTASFLLDGAAALAVKAGRRIMEVYERGFEVEYKADSSPVTGADIASHEIIEAGLKALSPDIPVISEEGAAPPYALRKGFARFWLVDPLDGTMEFIKRNDEFTVNIALVESGSVVLGVMYVPAKGALYYGRKGAGAFRQEPGGEPVRLVRTPLSATDPVRAVVSRSHPSPEVAEYLKDYEVASTLEAGSSLKFCLVAEGRADIYPRLAPTWEWDSAAGHAVAEAAGCVVTLPDGGPLTYNKEGLQNPGFVVRVVPMAEKGRKNGK